ncbi:MAG TPA: hypothetical protein VG053_10955 [Solirubrobacteraceae bacterium]|jgi:hypothetical protein|nr:hypothetical protein [Solirubrobacteraceae bacterium]
MFQAIRTRISATSVVAVLALVLAMSGGAYAAKKYLITSTKQISPSVLASLKGKAGPAGANGAQGAQGPAGPQGAGGAKGETGAEGKEGKAGGDGKAGATGPTGKSGVNGKGVAVAGESAGANCKEGGSSFEQEGSGTKTYACNGKEGSPWTAGGTLPSGKTETGVWAISVNHKILGAGYPISFPIPLSKALAEEEHRFVIQPGKAGLEHAVECPGTVSSPKAKQGYLCLYIEEMENFTALGFGLTWVSGDILNYGIPKEEFGSAVGTWAVTAE